MGLDPVWSLVRHEIGDRLAVATDHDGLAARFYTSQQAGEVGFRFVDVYRFHCGTTLVHLVHIVNDCSTSGGPRSVVAVCLVIHMVARECDPPVEQLGTLTLTEPSVSLAIL